MKTYRQLLFEVDEQKRPTIMLDMDGVVADYLKGAKELVGMGVDEWKSRAKKMADSKGNVPPEVSNNKMNKIISDAGVAF